MSNFYARPISCQSPRFTSETVDGAFVARLKGTYAEAQIVELTAAVALENFRSKFNPTLGVEAQGFCLIPRK